MRRRSYLVACLIIHASARAPKFEPYANNHGSAAAAAGADFVYLASDAQHVAGMTIASCQERQRGLTPRRGRAAAARTAAAARDLVVEAAATSSRAAGAGLPGPGPGPRAPCTGGGARVLAQPVLAGLDRRRGAVLRLRQRGLGVGGVSWRPARRGGAPARPRRAAPARAPGGACPRFASADDARAALVAASAAARRDSTVGGVMSLALARATAPSGTRGAARRRPAAAAAPSWSQRRRRVVAEPVVDRRCKFVCSSRPEVTSEVQACQCLMYTY